MRACTFALILTLAAGCSVPSEPQIENVNDPLFGEQAVPNGPEELRLASSTPTSLTLTWKDRSSFETAYRLERATAFPFGYVDLAGLAADVVTHTDTTVSPTVVYYYRVVALHGEITSRASNVLFVKYDPDQKKWTGQVVQ